MPIDFRPAPSLEDGERILRMDGICFPVDEPPSVAGAQWIIGWDGAMPAAYCAWKTSNMTVFKSASTIAPAFFPTIAATGCSDRCCGFGKPECGSRGSRSP